MAMGIAEVIPGVSGGTIAFITGIYERLLRSIRSVGPELLQAYKQGGISLAWAKLDGWFLVNLFVGMALGVGIGVVAVEYLLMHYPEPLWSFFFGLIIASCVYVARMIDRWSVSAAVALAIGIIVAYGVTTLAPAEGSSDLWWVFVSGMIAISALILPGISGSFILLIMGMYHIVIPSIKSAATDRDAASLSIFAAFAAGAVVGVATFSRVVSFLFERYERVTLALLTGFMLGSLRKLWPWRNTSLIKMDDGLTRDISSYEALSQFSPDDYKVLVEDNVLPVEYWMGSPKIIAVVAAFLVGLAIVFVLERLGSEEEG